MLKKRTIKIFIPALIILSICVGVWANPVWRNSFLKGVMSEKAYFKYVLAKGGKEFFNNISADYKLLKNISHGKNSAAAHIRLYAGKEEKNNIKKYTGYNVNTLPAKVDSVGIFFEAGKTNSIYGTNLGFSVNGSDLVGVEFTLVQEGLYVLIPELNSKAIFISAENKLYGEKIKAILQSLKSFDNIFICQDYAMDIMLNCASFAVDNISDIDENTIGLTAGGVSQKVTQIKVKLTGEDVKKIIIKFFEEIKNDSNLKNTILTEYKNNNFEKVYAEFLKHLDDVQNDFVKNSFAKNKEYIITFDADNRGNITGVAFEWNENKIKYYNTGSKKKSGAFFSFKNNGFEVSYEEKSDGNHKNGTLCVMGAEVAKVKKELSQNYIKKITITPGDNLESVMGLAFADNEFLAKNILRTKVTIESDSQKELNKNYKISAFIDDSKLGTINCGYSINQKSNFAIPESHIRPEDANAMESWQADVLTKVLTSKEFSEFLNLY